MENNLLLIGGGGHCRSVLDSILSLGLYDNLGIIDSSDDSVLGIPVVGTDDDLSHLKREGWNQAFVTVGSIGDTSVRKRLFAKLQELDFHIPVVIDPSAIVGRDVIIGKGSFIGKKAVVNSGSKIGDMAIINSGAIVEHDCFVGDFSHISPGTILCGGVQIGKDSHIGAGTVVIQSIHIGDNVLIGAGSTIVKSINENVKAYGNPGKVVES